MTTQKENKMESKNSQTKQQDFWSASDQEKIVKTLSIIINGQKAYGKDVSIEDTFAFYQLKLDGRFPADAVINALGAYTDRSNDIPAPADLISLMAPQTPRITQTEFIHAKEQHKLEGYPEFGYYGQIIKQYERENAEDRAPAPEIHPQLAQSLRKAIAGG